MRSPLDSWPTPEPGDSASIIGWRRWGLICAEAEAIENFARWCADYRSLFERKSWFFRWRDSGSPNGAFSRWSVGLQARVWYDEECGGGYQVVEKAP